MNPLKALASRAALTVAKGHLYALGEPYGLLGIGDITLAKGYGFEFQADLDGEESLLRITGRLEFPKDSPARIVSLTTGRVWIDKVLSHHLVGRPLPLDDTTANKLRGLWPT